MNELEKIEVDLKLTVAHVNTILAHLAKGVYSEVVDLISHLRSQALPQVAAAAPVAPTEPAAPVAPTEPAAPAATTEPAAPATETPSESVPPTAA